MNLDESSLKRKLTLQRCLEMSGKIRKTIDARPKAERAKVSFKDDIYGLKSGLINAKYKYIEQLQKLKTELE